MRSKWRDVALEDVADELTVGYVGPMASEYVDDGIPFLRSLNVDPLRINKNDLKFITPEFHSRIRKSRLTPGDVVIVRTGKPGACSVVPGWLADANCSDLVIVRCGPQLDNRFLAYYVNTVACDHVAAHLVGAVQQHFNVGSARTLRLNLPPLAEQKAIASILGALDDKIELNRRMNATLEGMARALFQSWFVDFDPVRAKLDGRKPEGMDKATTALFPDAFQDSPIGHVPTGWLVGSLADIMDIQGGTQPPASEFLSEATDGYVRLVQIRDYESESHLTFVRDNSKLRKCYRDDVMIARYGASVARICWGLEGAYNVALVKAAPHKACYREFLRSYLQAHDFQARLIGMSNRSVQAGFNKGDIASFQIAIAPDDVLEKYQTSAWELRKRILHNKDESRTLATLRDTLLPKLLSGELSVVNFLL